MSRSLLLIVVGALCTGAGCQTTPPPPKPTRLLPVIIDSLPGGAAVLEDGSRIGVTPLTIKRPEDARLLFEIVKDGYKVGRRSVRVLADMRTVFVQLRPLTATILVDTPGIRGARVTVDARYRGRSPLRVEGLRLGKHKLIVEKAGAPIIRREVALQRAGHTKRVTIDMLAAMKAWRPAHDGLIRVSSDVPATVSSGRRRLGVTPIRNLRLGSGEFELVARAVSSGKVKRRKISILRGRTVHVKFTFRK